MRWRFGGGSATWRVAKALVTLLTYIDSVWPDRQPTDGTVGDLSHQARRSDHNPNPARVVTAGDVGITSIPQGNRLVSELVASRDPRIKYIIFNGRIWRSYDKPGLPAWTPARYTGSNQHKTHVHISVSSQASRYDDPSPWNISLTDEEENDMPFTEHEIARLKEMVASLDQVGDDEIDNEFDEAPSSGHFVKHAVHLIRKERKYPLEKLTDGI